MQVISPSIYFVDLNNMRMVQLLHQLNLTERQVKVQQLLALQRAQINVLHCEPCGCQQFGICSSKHTVRPCGEGAARLRVVGFELSLGSDANVPVDPKTTIKWQLQTAKQPCTQKAEAESKRGRKNDLLTIQMFSCELLWIRLQTCPARAHLQSRSDQQVLTLPLQSDPAPDDVITPKQKQFPLSARVNQGRITPRPWERKEGAGAGGERGGTDAAHGRG